MKIFDMEENNNKHSQVPNNMMESGLSPREQLVYAVLHSFNNPKNECFPSLTVLSEVSQLSIPTIRDSLNKLKDSGYIKIEKKGRKNYYYFSKYINFEPFSDEFLSRKDITPTTKSYLVAAQQFMYKDIEGIGKVSYSNRELAKQINMAESSIRKCNAELKRNNFLTIVKNENRDLETGCKKETKIFNLVDLGQAVIWTLNNHEERIVENTENIEKLKQKLEIQEKLINKLLEERNINKQEFIM